MRRRTLIILLALATIPTGGLTAFAVVKAKRSVSFGDSLTHNDLLHEFFPAGRAVYGADPFEAAFSKAARRNDELLNFAILGSTSSEVLVDQVDVYAQLRRERVLKHATLLSFQAGANDVLDNIFALASAPPGANPGVDGIVLQIKLNILTAVFKLAIVDWRADLVVWTVPDVTQIPLVQLAGLPAPALQNIRAHIECINDAIRLIGHSRRVAVLDVYNIFRDAVANPPTFLGMTLIGPPAFGDFDHLFADPLHPTAVSNAILANGIIRAMNAKFNDDIPLYNELELALLAFPALAL